ncbi:PREDICTED: transforming growth factor beta-1-induced transcript 1 protein-like [Papilio xuthus]|uniref:Transforming growth factor beta-1-induced transcript 1 protein-like n=1 Tax=Papilio xuthus TaxID=66420 RepID=A0AAJ7E5X3_PAPXU|nr:PREDICTED: transforming growth factor beta-1-induced transcript 1 protein-like [Papilio xuthus]
MSTNDAGPAICNSCNAVIQGRIVTALNKKWHPEHFACNTCRKPIDGSKFHQHDGGVVCVPCYAQHYSPRCHGCGDPITDRVIQALGVSWHSNHFVCGGCRKELGGGGFMEQAGRPYCSGCYAEKFAARCASCSKPIVDKAIIALNAKWHGACFTCKKCRNPVTDSTFSVLDNMPLCGKCA